MFVAVLDVGCGVSRIGKRAAAALRGGAALSAGSSRRGARVPVCGWLSCGPTGCSGGRGERSGAREGVDERVAPGPARVDAQDRGAGVKGEASGDVQQPVAQALGLAAGELAGQREALGRGEQVVGDQDEREPDAVVLEVSERQVAQAGVFVIADVVFATGALAVTALKDLDVGIGLSASPCRRRSRLVCQDGLEAVAVVVGERQLGAGMRAFAPDDYARPLGPRREVQRVGDLDDLPVGAWTAVCGQRRDPLLLGDLQDRGAHLLAELLVQRS